jgi:hypothetical protein
LAPDCHPSETLRYGGNREIENRLDPRGSRQFPTRASCRRKDKGFSVATVADLKQTHDGVRQRHAARVTVLVARENCPTPHQIDIAPAESPQLPLASASGQCKEYEQIQITRFRNQARVEQRLRSSSLRKRTRQRDAAGFVTVRDRVRFADPQLADRKP